MRFHMFHRWSQWQYLEEITMVNHGGRPVATVHVQCRRCADCNLIQYKKIRV